MAEKFQRLKFDREIDAIEWTKDPDAYTFKPVILGDKRAGQQNTKSTKQLERPETAPPVERTKVLAKENMNENKQNAMARETDMKKRKTQISKN